MTGGKFTVRAEFPGLALLAAAVLFTAWLSAPELRINRVPANDLVFHIAASERLGTAFERGEPFLDPWVSEWSLGYPVWRSYQPLPHAVAALLMKVFGGLGSHIAVFLVFYYLLLIALPVSTYLGARLLDLPPPAAGIAAMFIFASSAGGDFELYGLGYGSWVWRGSGLYTQLFALHLAVIALGVTARALESGKRSLRVIAGILLALTTLSHMVFGYAAFLSSVLLALVGSRGRVKERLKVWATIVLPSMLLLAWFVIPLIQARGIVDHSLLEHPWKWNSFGAPAILRALFSGQFLDSGRLPLLTLLCAVGTTFAIFSWRDPRALRLLALSSLWLMLFFGRATWGPLLILAGIPADLPLHRFQAMFEMCLFLLSAYGLAGLIRFLDGRRRVFALAAAAAIALAMVPIAIERAGYLNTDKSWGEATLAAYDADRPDLEAALSDVRAILAERPGRVSAGMSATWGGKFRIGLAPLFTFLSLNHIDQVSYLYHSMAKTSDIMAIRNENYRGHDAPFGIRAYVIPSNAPITTLRRRGVHGRFAVYEAADEGYFGVVDIGSYYDGPADGDYGVSYAWLQSPLLAAAQVISLDDRAPAEPRIHAGKPLPGVSPQAAALHGSVLSETKTGENYQARIQVNKPAYAFLKITWNPSLAATVDGRAAPVMRVTPGFAAVPLPAGEHNVSVAYKPGILKPALLFLGAGSFVLVWFFIPVSRPPATDSITPLKPAIAKVRLKSDPPVETRVDAVARKRRPRGRQ